MEARFTGDFEWLNNDPVNDIMNSARGHIYDAMIACSLQEVRIEGGAPFWDEDVRSLFTQRLVEKTGGIEFYWSLGFKVPQISYLDMDWLKYFKDTLVEVQDDKNQLPVFYGFILFAGQLYTNLYELFYPTYLSQIHVKINHPTIVRRLVEHIWVAFAIDLDKSKPLIDQIIDSADLQKITSLIDRIKIEDSLQKDDKIRYVWARVMTIVEKSTDPYLQEKAFEMVYFAELLQNFNVEDLDFFNRTISLKKSDVNMSL